MKCKLKSHPDKLLKEHLLGVQKTGMKIFVRNNLYNEYEDFISSILLLHDLGKASSSFQDYIVGKCVNVTLKRHAEISALWFYFYAKEILKIDEKFAILGFIIIKYHHADLGDFHSMCMNSLSKYDIFKINSNIDYQEFQYIVNDDFFTHDNFEKYYNELTRNGVIKTTRKIKKILTHDDYFFLNYFFSILLTADKCNAITNQDLPDIKHSWNNDFVDNFKQQFSKIENKIVNIRNQAYDEVESNIDLDNKIFSINLPTGAGKTLTVLNAALKLKKRANTIQRIIYCLPFTSVIDQNAKVFEDILKFNKIKPTSDTLLKQHHLTKFSYIKSFEDEDKIYSAMDSEFFIEGWESEMIVTTFFQFLNTLLSNKNKALRKFHNLTNSIIILDEVQTIPHKYWKLIKVMLYKSAQILNCRFILVTATMPLIFSEKKNEIKELAKSKTEYYNSLSRIKLNTENLKQNIDINSFKEIILNDINLNIKKSRLIILNTVKASLEVYNYLKDKIDSNNLIYLSSNIVPKERLLRISQIKINPTNKIIISTQLVEAGVDIDIDVVYRDMAPLDSIFQACGRCNRNSSVHQGIVKLFKISKNKKEYNSYIYDPVLTDSTNNILTKNEFEEKSFLSLSEKYFFNLENHAMGAESSELLNKINNLEYAKSFYKDDDGKEVFQLINQFSVISSFIEINNEASQIYNEYLSLSDKIYNSPFEKRIELKTIHRKMAPYMINIPERNAKNAGYDESLGKIWFITKELVNLHYDNQTGFIRDKEIIDFIF